MTKRKLVLGLLLLIVGVIIYTLIIPQISVWFAHGFTCPSIPQGSGYVPDPTCVASGEKAAGENGNSITAMVNCLVLVSFFLVIVGGILLVLYLLDHSKSNRRK